jgi:DNA-binding CsgD family transcriptional regulator
MAPGESGARTEICGPRAGIRRVPIRTTTQTPAVDAGGEYGYGGAARLWWDGRVAVVSGDVVRTAEWHQVREFAASAWTQPAALVIAGEAGAGKSTLWRAGAATAADAGHRLLRSEPSAAEADLPFAALSDLLTDVLPDVGRQIPDPQREALEVALLLRPAGPEPPTARAVGLAVLAALRGLTAAGPVLVAIDDVQWVDEASLEALTFAFRRADSGPLGLLVAARTEAPADPLTAVSPPPPEGWCDLVTAVPADTIDLAPLDQWQVQRLLPRTVSSGQARTVARQSRGNPFWALQIAASLQAANTPVPPLARTLTERLARSLSADGGEALAVVAGAGRITVADAVAALNQLKDPAAALDEAVLAGVVVETGDRLAPTHPLIGAAAIEALPPGRRQRLYRQLASTAGSPERYAHFAALAAGPAPDAAVADALDAATASAHGRAGNAEAAQFAAQAVAFTPGPDQEALVRRRIRAGELLFLAGDLCRSLEYLEALDLRELTIADLERALPLLVDNTETVYDAGAANAIIARAVAEAGPDPHHRALVLALASDTAYGIPGRRRDLAAEAIRNAEAAGPAADAALHRALLNLLMAKVLAGDGLDTELLERAEHLESRVPVARLYDAADLERGLWSRYVEKLDTARAALQRCIARAREAGDDYALFTFLSYLAATEELAGDYQAARAAVAASDAAATWHDWPLSPWHVEPRCELLIVSGDLDSAVSVADQHLRDRDGAAPALIRALIWGRVSSWRGDAAGAARYLEAAAQHADELEFADPAVRQWLDPVLAEAYVAEERPGDALRISARLRETGERLRRPALVGAASRIDALAAAQAGDLDAAAESARAAVAAHETAPLRVELARSLLALGQIERRLKARKQSRGALARAQALAREMGHKPLQAQIDRELPRVAAARSGHDLTATEQRVAELIAAGATNRDAAAALFVSVRTVETHVAAIYRKLGVRTRAELARRYSGRPAR